MKFEFTVEQLVDPQRRHILAEKTRAHGYAIRANQLLPQIEAAIRADERKRIMEGAERVYGYEHKHGTSWHSEGEPSFQFTALLIQITPLKEGE